MLSAMTSIASLDVLVVDDHGAVREGLHALLEQTPGLEPAGAAANGREAIALANESRPRVVILDVHLPGEDGLSLCLRLKSATDPPAVILYSAFADERLAVRGIVAGADAVVPKSEDPDVLCRVAFEVARGNRPILEISADGLRDASARLHPEDLPVIGMLVHGTPPDEIASTLSVTYSWLTARRWAMLAALAERVSSPDGP
jgi:DNA-binding NarL/FixJ family response regulator